MVIVEKLDIQSNKLCWLVYYGHGELGQKEKGLSYLALSRKPKTHILKGNISALDEQGKNPSNLDKELFQALTILLGHEDWFELAYLVQVVFSISNLEDSSAWFYIFNA